VFFAFFQRVDENFVDGTGVDLAIA